METTKILKAIGEETIKIESLYLNLKIEKALKGDEFKRENQLAEAEILWREADSEYYGLLSFLQLHPEIAA